jgi:hypothetical protein
MDSESPGSEFLNGAIYGRIRRILREMHEVGEDSIEPYQEPTRDEVKASLEKLRQETLAVRTPLGWGWLGGKDMAVEETVL